MAAGMKPNWEYTYCFVGSYKTYAMFKHILEPQNQIRQYPRNIQMYTPNRAG